jgi:hypothetical protein
MHPARLYRWYLRERTYMLNLLSSKTSFLEQFPKRAMNR